MEIWVFSFIISIFQIFPDWFLSAELNILVFPDDGLFKIGPVSGYMFGLWTIPLFIIIFIGIRSKEKFNERTAMILVCALSLIIFGTAEATIWIIGSWYPQNVAKIGQLAIYILPAEVILGFSSYYCFTRLNKEHIVYIPLLAFLIMLLYMGSSSFFYLLVEKIIL
jgi:NADH:ubiquinone oxidoreductase subunit 2 (subunit N)